MSWTCSSKPARTFSTRITGVCKRPVVPLKDRLDPNSIQVSVHARVAKASRSGEG